MENPISLSLPADGCLIETLRIDAKGPVRGELHLARLCTSARVFGIPLSMTAARALINEPVTEPTRARLTLTAAGALSITRSQMAPTADTWVIDLAEASVNSADPWFRHKTSQRLLYDKARSNLPNGIDEVIFVNERGRLTEGTITNLFVRMDGVLWTPPLSDGVLPGVLRRSLIEAGELRSKHLAPADLQKAEQIFVGNSLRGLIPARLGGGLA